MSQLGACDECLARSWLLARLSAHLDVVRSRVPAVLDLGDDDLIAAVAGRDEPAVRGERERFDARDYAAACAAAGLDVICRCHSAYPAPLWSLSAEPAVLHIAGGAARFLDLVGVDPVAIVGARRASPYALENARSLARGVARCRVTVVSGLAAGVDSAAHEGALDARGGTIAVLPSAPQRPYPPAKHTLHRRIVESGAAVSELGPNVPVRRWMFPARNRIVAALSVMTVVVAARKGSGALTTAKTARTLKRALGAVPGQITSPLAWGPHQLIKDGARLVTETTDIVRPALGTAAALDRVPSPPVIARGLQPLFDALADGLDAPEAFEEAGLDVEQGLAQLAELELAGHIRRQPGGRFSIIP
jgi:DNA processing protein